MAALAETAKGDPAVKAEPTRPASLDAKAKLEPLRAALENGTAAPALIRPWLADADQERAAAEIDLQALDATAGPDMTEALRTLLVGLGADYGDMAAVLADADPADKAALLSTLGVRVEWVPTADRAKVTMATDGPSATERVGGGT